MLDKKLVGKKIAMLATDGFEQSELLEPKKALEMAGADVHIVSLKMGSIKSWHKNNWADSVAVDRVVSDAVADQYDGLVLPGGVLNPDQLRINAEAVQFVREFAESGKPIAAICHGPWTLIETDFLEGRTVTSWPSLKTDLMNAGAKWVDKSVVVDKGLITSRKPDDIPAFIEKMIEAFMRSKNSTTESMATATDGAH